MNIKYKLSAVLIIVLTMFFGQAIFTEISKYVSQFVLTSLISHSAPILVCEKTEVNLSKIVFGFDINKPLEIIQNETVSADNTDVNVVSKTIETPIIQTYDTSAGVKIKNSTDYEIDVDTLINQDLKFRISDSEPSVLIIHTHTSESYLKTEDINYESSDSNRTQNPDFNVIRIGKEFKDALQSKGVISIHDTTVHDYPSYNGSYLNAQKTIEDNLKKYPSVKIVVDIHRDAVESNGNVYKLATSIDGKKAAQVMIVSGTDANGIDNPNWRENLKFALKYQRRLNLLFPTLARDIDLRRERFNTHLTLGSIILEVGTTGNTLEEAIYSARLCGIALGDMLSYITD